MPIYRHPITWSEQPAAQKLRAIPLDRDLISRLKSVYRAARKNDDRTLAKIFYGKLFAAHPQLRKMFPEDLEQQASKLIAMFDQVVDSLESPEQNVQLLAELGRRHKGYGVLPEHYPIVVELLTESMKELLGSAKNPNGNQKSIEEWRLMLTLISQQMTRQSGFDSVERRSLE
jgi:hemoglobin-like flavoprotein